MKVVIINKSAAGGGAAVASNRLYTALKQNKVNVNMLVEDAVTNDSNLHSLSNTKLAKHKAFCRFVRERLHFLPFEKNSQVRYAFSPAKAGINISQHPLIQDADIIHIHWINQGFLSLKNLQQLFMLNKPIIWTMHDMWPFTGGCHYAGECNHYTNNCGHCIFLRWSNKTDLSAQIHQTKLDIWNQANMHAVACSKWLGSLAQKSTLLRNKQISSIPNPIDTDIFIIKDKEKCRKELGLPTNKKLLLFGAAKISDPRKGIKYLIEAIQILNTKYPKLKNELELVIFGKCDIQELKKFAFKVHPMHFISNTDQMIKLYNSADAFALPSLQDNLPNTVMESLSCGVPVVSFNVGGVPEMVEHNKSGYLAKIKCSDDLSNGIYNIINHPCPNTLKENARNFVVNNYSNHIIAERYLQVYRNALIK